MLADRAGAMRRSVYLLASLLATACAAPSDDGGGGGGGKGDDTTSPRITFSDDFSERVSGELVAGGTVSIDYDLDRLSDCRGSTGGSEVWGVTGWVKFGTSAPTSFAVSRLDGGRVVPVVATIDLPESATTMALWFTINNRWGCIAYDSNEGADYHWDVATPSDGDAIVLDFAADYSLDPSGPVRAGDRVIVHYDPSRLDECAGSTGGNAAWSITGRWQVDGGTVHTLAVTRADGPDLVPADPSFTVPSGRDLALWFEATSVWGCHAWDSNFGGNYHVTIE